MAILKSLDNKALGGRAKETEEYTNLLFPEVFQFKNFDLKHLIF